MKRLLVILLAICTVLALGQTVFADDSVTFKYTGCQCNNDSGIYTSVYEEPRCVIDGNKSTKMLLNGFHDSDNVDTNIEFEASEGIMLTGYTLTSANDSTSYPERNPKSWELYGKNRGGEWVLLDSVVNDERLGTEDSGDFYYEVQDNTTYYKYYKVHFTSVHGGNQLQLAEITCSYTRCTEHDWNENYVCNKCWQTASAVVGDTPYINLSDALSNVENDGTVKLVNDCYINQRNILSGKSITLDLNGHIVQSDADSYMIKVKDGATLKIIDSNPNATHSDTSKPNGGFIFATADYNSLMWVDDGTVVLKGGSFQSEQDAVISSSESYGVSSKAIIEMYDGASIINSKDGIQTNGKIYMYGGSIIGNGDGTSYDAIENGHYSYELYMYGGTISGFENGVRLCESDSKFLMSGGVIKNCNRGVYMTEDEVTVELSGNAKIENCSGEKSGGGICCSDDECTITLKDNAVIANCSVARYGGGIYIGDHKNTLIIEGNAKITGCTAGREGGGVYIDEGDSSINTFVLSGSAVIENCKAVNEYTSFPDALGGGVYLGDNVEFTIKDNAAIKNCEVTSTNGNSYGAGIYFAKAYNDKGTVINANGGTVENGVYIEAPQTEYNPKPAGIIKCTSGVTTNFLAGAENHGTIAGGIYYGSFITGDGEIDGKTITFISDGNVYAVEVVAEGNTSAKPIDPEKTDYAFAAWYTDEQCTKEYTFGSAVPADIKLYAGYRHTNHIDENDDHYCDICDEKVSDHDFSLTVVDAKYKATDADCTHKATYYYSCLCGKHGEKTFEHGEALGHILGNWIYNRESHWKKCSRCGELLENEEHIFTEWSGVYGEKNKEERHCTVCGHEQFATIINANSSASSKKPDTEQNPNTGAPAISMAPLAMVLAAAVVLKKHR